MHAPPRPMRRLHIYVYAHIDIYVYRRVMYTDSAACRWQWRRTTAEKIIKYTKCKMQIPRDIHENGQKKGRKKWTYEMYILRETRDASEACATLFPSCTPFFSRPQFFSSSFFSLITDARARERARVCTHVGLRVRLITGI